MKHDKEKYAIDNESIMSIIAININIKVYSYENHTNDP